jgi:aldose 1-epimerase
MSAQIELAAGDARVALAPHLGGSIVAFEWQGRPVMRLSSQVALAAGKVRDTCCYPLVPYSNRIEAARLHFDGQVHELDRNFGDHPHAIHGVGWQRPWLVAEAGASSARLTFEHSAQGEQRRAWPWAFAASQFFALHAEAGAGATLTMTLSLANRSTQTFPFGLGWHPYFPKHEDTQLQFHASGVWLTDATVLPREHTRVPREFDFEAKRPVGRLEIDNVFTGWNGVVTLDHPELPFGVTIEGDSACPFLVVYTRPSLDFMAIEPVTQMTDAFNRAARGEQGTGMRLLPPGAEFSCTMRVSVRPHG